MPAGSPSEVWSRALDLLKGQMTRATFDAWLARTWVVDAPSPDGDEGSEWVIAVPNPRALDWLTHRLAPTIARTLSWTVGAPTTVRFVVESPELTPHSPRPTCQPVRQNRRQAGDGSGEGDDLEDAPALDAPALAGASSKDEPSPPGETLPPGEASSVLEAVREQRVPVGEDGVLVWTDFYIKLKVAFRKRALGKLKGARLSVFLCLSLHVDRDGIARPGGIETIMHETAYSRGAVCSALEYLESAGLIQKLRRHHGADEYQVLGYAWFGQQPAPALWEAKSEK
jgi:hypothetical protein